jgi:insertion element IS1 protein InsB
VVQPSAPRWCWQASAQHRGTAVAEVFGRRQNAGLLPWPELWAPLHLPRVSPEGWGADARHIAPAQPMLGQAQPQQSDRQPSNVRPRLTRLRRRTLCLSKPTTRHHLVVGLCSKRDEFAVAL